jgi:pyrimidine-specific ribonucleoside hydrolase
VRLWIDTDVGSDPDDAVALLCAASHPSVDLVGVSTVDDDAGSRASVARELVDAPVVEGPELAPRQVAGADPEALLAIGPLENVARLVASGVLPPRVGVMGGALRPVRHRGADREVEHNFGTQPAATRAVIEHASGILLCPLDVTVRMKLSADDARRMVDAAPVLRPMFDGWIALLRAEGMSESEAAVRLHDPLALLALLGEPVVRLERRRLTIDDDGGVKQDPGRGNDVEVVTDVDAAQAMRRIVALVT